jgi:hypothetical protein
MMGGSAAKDLSTSRRLKTSVLGRLVTGAGDSLSMERDWVEAWVVQGARVVNSNLENIDVSGYLQVKRDGRPYTYCLGSYGPGANDGSSRRDYSALWEEGPCSGWQPTVPDVRV